MKTALPDVNVLLALVAEGHVHHEPARAWFYAQSTDSVAICRITQMGVLRLLTNRKVLGSGVRSIREAWSIERAIKADRRVVFAQEPEELESIWAELMAVPGVGSGSCTDAYLAAFAKARECTVVTFDRGFARWQGVECAFLVDA